MGISWLAWSAALLVMVAAGKEPVQPMRLEWNDNMLTVFSPALPGERLEIWYLEAFCRGNSTDRDWAETVIPHKTTKLDAGADGTTLKLKSVVEPGVVVMHDIHAGRDEVEFRLTLTNPTDQYVDVQWAQPCIRVGPFTGLGQDEYIERCFIYTKAGTTTLDKTTRTEEARYRGGQVYVPDGINLDDVNPRPISPDVPAYPVIGCVSADEKMLLATTWDQTQELFQGVITCIHADFRVGGMNPGETKTLRGKLYLMPNDPDKLLARYRQDFLVAK